MNTTVITVEKLIMNFYKVLCHDLTVTEKGERWLMDFYITGMEKSKDILIDII